MAKSSRSEYDFKMRLAARLAKIGARVGVPPRSAPYRQRYRFRIRTRRGTTAGVSYYARDLYDAQNQLYKNLDSGEKTLVIQDTFEQQLSA